MATYRVAMHHGFYFLPFLQVAHELMYKYTPIIRSNPGLYLKNGGFYWKICALRVVHLVNGFGQNLETSTDPPPPQQPQSLRQ